MALNFATRFASLALPVMVAATPVYAFAECANDSFGYSDRLSNIEIDLSTLTPGERQALRGANAYYAGLDHIQDAAENEGNSIVDAVLQERLDIIEALGDGQRPEDFGMPTYQNYNAAEVALACAMIDTMTGTVMQQDRKTQRGLEAAYIRLLWETAITEADIRDRLETIARRGAQGALGENEPGYSYAEQLINAIEKNIDVIAQDPYRAEGFITFALNELQNSESDYNFRKLSQILAPLIVTNPSYMNDYLDAVETNDQLFDTTFETIFNRLESREFDERIFDILVQMINSNVKVVPRKAANKLLDLVIINPSYQDDVFDAFYANLSNAEEYIIEEEFEILGPRHVFSSLRTRTRSILHGTDEAQKLYYLDFWQEVLQSDGITHMPSDQLDMLLINLDRIYSDQTIEVQIHITDLAHTMYALGASEFTRYIPAEAQNTQDLIPDN